MTNPNFNYELPQSTAFAIARADGKTTNKSVVASHGPLRQQQLAEAAFAPERQGNSVEAFSTGKAYFESVAAAIQSAKKTIFICGWQVDWGVELIPAVERTPGLRLIDALKNALDNSPNLRIYIMPWMSPKVGVNTGDLGTMLAVFQLNAGRKGMPALCCPAGLQNDYTAIEETFFSHHQKLVVIDNQVAYVGGIDLAFGRRDDERFTLTHESRVGPEVYNTGVPPATELDAVQKQAYLSEAELIQTSLSVGLIGSAVQTQNQLTRALANSSVGRWTSKAIQTWRENKLPDWMQEPINDLKASVQAKYNELDDPLTDDLIRKLDAGVLDSSDVTTAISKVGDFMHGAYLTLLGTSWMQREPNYELLLPRVQSSPAGWMVYRADQPRMPWQDVQVKISGPSVYDLSMNFVRRWNSLQHAYLPSDLVRLTAIPKERQPAKPAEGKGNGGEGKVSVRVLRSAPLHLQQEEFRATPGLPRPIAAQDEIHDAMVAAIQRAKRFIYIENQFFQSGFGTPSIDPWTLDGKRKLSGPMRHMMSFAGSRVKAALTRASAKNTRSLPKNHIALALAQRIEAAIRYDQPFHVYMVLPVHPEGSLADMAIAGQVHWTMQSLVYASDSLINRIKVAIKAKEMCKQARDDNEWLLAKHRAKSGDPASKLPQQAYLSVNDAAVSQYLTLLNLRNCQTVGGKVRTEQIYVHSKLLIVDDLIAIVGSANINDRSLHGGRDSELAVCLTDTQSEEAPLDGSKPVKVRRLVHQLRMDLWKKHFAEKGGNDVVQPANALLAMLDKPADPATWTAIQKQAQANAQAYAAVFDFVPKLHGDGSSLWPTLSLKEKAAAQGPLNYDADKKYYQPAHDRMPFAERFWQVNKSYAKPVGVKGFICALPLTWTAGENNHPDMNVMLLTQTTPSLTSPLDAAARSALS